MNAFESLQAAIKAIHGCESSHYESVPITEREQDVVVWQGVVEVFLLKGHPTAKRCYAWKQSTLSDEHRFVSLLKITPVDTPRRAVREFLTAESAGNSDKISSIKTHH